MKIILAFLNFINISIMLIFWWRYAVPIAKCNSDFLNNTDALSHFLASQANHFSLLQIYLTLVTLGFAALALWGYGELKRAAVERTEKVINDKMTGIVKEWLEGEGRETISRLIFEGKMEESATETFKSSQSSVVSEADLMEKDPYEPS